MNCTPGVFRLLDVLVEFGGDALGRPLTEYSCPAQHIRDRRVPIRLGGSRQRNRTRWAVGFGVFAEILAYLVLGCVLDVFTIWPLAVIVVAIFLARLAARLVRLNKEGQI